MSSMWWVYIQWYIMCASSNTFVVHPVRAQSLPEADRAGTESTSGEDPGSSSHELLTRVGIGELRAATQALLGHLE